MEISNPERAVRFGGHITPRASLIFSGIIALSAVFFSAQTAMRSPWMGVSLAGNENGLRVTSVSESGPSANILSAGDVIVSLADQEGNVVHLRPRDIIDDPDTIPNLAERNVFRERQTLIYRILQRPVVSLTIEDGRVVRVQPQTGRPLRSLPISFWLLSLYSIIALLIGFAVWSVKQRSVPTRYLLLSAVGALCLLNSVNIIISRELALDGSSYPPLTFFYHAGNNLFSLGMIGLVWHYPRALVRFPVIPVLIIFMLFFLLNENLEWTELPVNSVLIQVPFYMAAGITIMAAQWSKTRGRPVDRAAVKALTLMIWVVVLTIAGYYLTSIMYSGVPALSLAGSFFAMFAIYLALALAVVRYRLFDIDRWWIEVWLWFFAGIAIIAFDVALVTVANLGPPYALSISVIVVGWLYFPVRQWVWAKLFRHRRRGLEDYLPMLISHFVREDRTGRTQFWKNVLSDVFRPLAMDVKKEATPDAVIIDNGVRLRTPSLDPEYSIELAHADKGSRLFNSEDVKLIRAIYNISARATGQREHYMRGILDERKRIMRDLHDDIGGRLLTLIHADRGEFQTAAEALKRLREIIYSLDTEQQVTLDAAVARWRFEASERCEQAGVGFEWQWEKPDEDMELAPRHALNLALVFREGLSNALKHAEVKSIRFDLSVRERTFRARFENDGLTGHPGPQRPGKGLRNMRARVEELGGAFEHACENGVFCVQFSAPLYESAGGTRSA